MSFRSDITVAILIGIVCLFGIFCKEYNYTSDEGLIGMAISKSFTITLLISFYLKTVIILC